MEMSVGRLIDVLFTACLVAAAAMLPYLIVWIGVDAIADSRCMELGWTDGVVTWGLGRYCYRQVDGTDFISPLRDVEAGRQALCTEPLDE